VLVVCWPASWLPSSWTLPWPLAKPQPGVWKLVGLAGAPGRPGRQKRAPRGGERGAVKKCGALLGSMMMFDSDLRARRRRDELGQHRTGHLGN
jgi:hypothetical protein